MQTPNSKDTKSTNISINQLSGIKRSQNKSPDMNVSISSNLNAMSLKKQLQKQFPSDKLLQEIQEGKRNKTSIKNGAQTISKSKRMDKLIDIMKSRPDRVIKMDKVMSGKKLLKRSKSTETIKQ